MPTYKNLSLFYLISCSAFACCIASYAGEPGPYGGLQLGYGNVHHEGISSSDMNTLVAQVISTFHVTSFSSSSNGAGVTGRIYAGFQMGDYFATEIGWAKFPNLPVHASAIGTNLGNGSPLTVTQSTGTMQTDAYDLVAKGIIPLPNHFNFYGKLGAAYLEIRPNESVFVASAGASGNSSYDTVNHRYYPTFGVGASYDITPNFGADISWNRIQKIGSSNIGSTDAFNLGLSYNFGPACSGCVA